MNTAQRLAEDSQIEELVDAELFIASEKVECALSSLIVDQRLRGARRTKQS